MISLNSARKLKWAGLVWKPKIHDFFAIPDRDLDDQIFVISDVQVTLDVLMGHQVVSFQGASEWALDSLVKDEAIWLPREDQLRKALEDLLIRDPESWIQLFITEKLSSLKFHFDDEDFEIYNTDTIDVYAQAILIILNR